MKDPKKVSQGKTNKKVGAAFELLVRKDLEAKGWFVAKWSNNIDFECSNCGSSQEKCKKSKKKGAICCCPECNHTIGKMIAAKHKFNSFNKAMSLGTGFPDFIAFRPLELNGKISVDIDENLNIIESDEVEGDIRMRSVIGVECKGGNKDHRTLDKEEKLKCKWLLDNKVFSKISIANLDYPEENINLPPKKRVKKSIKYIEFKNELGAPNVIV